ncbi:hypothetical protein M127_4864 [Bacteroides fragilis str. S6L5]|nr:hypothetical protein M127_4864 [Bacteroides fragilis str. S6L5]
MPYLHQKESFLSRYYKNKQRKRLFNYTKKDKNYTSFYD